MTPSSVSGNILNDPDQLTAGDTAGVLGAIEDLGGQCAKGWERGAWVHELPGAAGVATVVVAGMGGSGAAGDLVKAIVEPRLSVPMTVIKGYGLLFEWVGRNTLVFCVSYSGNTEETLEAFDEARERGARIVTICSGGELAERAKSGGVAQVPIPAGRQPRASLGYLAMPILATLCELGLVRDMQRDVEEAVELLHDLGRRCSRGRPVGQNPAKQLARRLHNRIPVVFGVAGLTGMVAMRFKTDLNEYAKVPAFWNVLPEANHNEIEGWVGDRRAGKQFVGVFVRDPGEHPRVTRHFEILKRKTSAVFSDVVELHPEGDSALARVMSFEIVTQLAAIYLALLRGIDPGPVHVLDAVKHELKARTSIRSV